MPVVVPLAEIKKALAAIDPLPLIEAGFVAYSRGRAVVPPVGELVFDDPPGDVHIKYGYIKGGDVYVIKIASGFVDNPKRGLPSGDGLMLVFDQKTGRLEALLLDEGYLTNLRTAVAGAIVAKYLAPQEVTAAGIIGAGVQGRMQLEWLRRVRAFDEAVVWGIDERELAAYRRDMERPGLNVRTTLRAEDVAAAANLIVDVHPVDSAAAQGRVDPPGNTHHRDGFRHGRKAGARPGHPGPCRPCRRRQSEPVGAAGEVYRAVAAGAIGRESLVELGRVIEDPALRRASEGEITVADLTGVAVQDIMISQAVWTAVKTS